jgi:hypothetical protein
MLSGNHFIGLQYSELARKTRPWVKPGVKPGRALPPKWAKAGFSWVFHGFFTFVFRISLN